MSGGVLLLYVDAKSIERNDRLCENSAHGSTGSPRAERVSLELKHLTARPERVEGRTTGFRTLCRCAQSSRSNVKMGIASLQSRAGGDGKPVLSEVGGSIFARLASEAF